MPYFSFQGSQFGQEFGQRSRRVMVWVFFVVQQGHVLRPGGRDGEAMKVLCVGSVDQVLVVTTAELLVFIRMGVEPAPQLHRRRHMGGAEFHFAQLAEFGNQVERLDPDPDAVNLFGRVHEVLHLDHC